MHKIICALRTYCLAVIGPDRSARTLDLIRDVIFMFFAIQIILQPNHSHREIQELLLMYIVVSHLSIAALPRSHAVGVTFNTYSLWLYRIYKEFLLAIEHRDADEKQNESAGSTVTESLPTEFSGSVCTILEGLDNGCHRVRQHDGMQGRI